MPHDTDIAIGLYISSPIPVLVYKMLHYIHSPPPEEPKIPVVTTEDPTAPTADEPSAV